MSNKLRYDDKVVVITGAGGGLGKAYALAFAERGAKVVVNDLGGGISGDDGKSTKAADVVVNEIKAKNGIAVANYDSVEDGEKIIKTALDSFGKIDILINNAGILRDKSFARTSDLDWDLIHRIHLRAAFLITRAAWPHMQKNKFGRIIMTSSGAGIYGNFGQANYSAAKLGLVGLSNTLSIEGQKYNIRCNAIAPVARSRLTQTVMPDDILDVLKPEFVAPLVLYLCHEDTSETGSLFEVGGGWIGKVRWEKSSGAIVKKGELMTPEDEPLYHTSIGESTNHCINVGQSATASNNSESANSSSSTETKYKYDFKDAILYALSLGVSTSNEKNLKFLYENHQDFSVYPMFGVIPAFSVLFSAVESFVPKLPVQIDPAKILHGEQYLEMRRPFKTSDTLTVRASLVDVLDKGSGASLIINVDLLDEKQQLVAVNQFVTFAVGSGNFGGKRDSDKLIKVSSKKFDRKPDRTLEEKTSVDQAALYRLNGDFNPLHIDPSFSAILGFDRPILHGLCTFGYAVKHVISAFCDDDVSMFKSVKVRFAKPVLPGQTIQTNMWLEKDTSSPNEHKVYFECKIVENQTVVISGAYVTLHGIKTGSSSTATVEKKAEATKKTDATFAADKIFTEIFIKLKENPDIAKSIKSVYAFQISKDDANKVYLVDLKQNSISNHEKLDGLKADCTILIKDEDFIGLASGTGNPQQMFMKGKLKVKGNIMLAQKLEKLFKTNSKL